MCLACSWGIEAGMASAAVARYVYVARWEAWRAQKSHPEHRLSDEPTGDGPFGDHRMRGRGMGEKDLQPTDELTPDELDNESAEALPDREQMSLISANVAAPVNAAVALNALSDNSVAIANATQTATIDQSN
jgi:hypothetical protein